MLTLVPTPIGNIGDISLRAIKALSEAEILLCEDTRVTKKLLLILKERYQLTISNPKFISFHSHNEKQFIATLQHSFFEKKVVYVSDAGMPGISDPGQMLVSYCIEHNIHYDVLPGANAVLTAFVASGFVDTKMLFYGFLPHKGKERTQGLQEVLHNGYTTVLYEAPHRLKKLLNEIQTQEPRREIFLAKELTKKYQTYFRGTPSIILENIGENIKGEWVVVIKATQGYVSSLTQKDILELDIPKKAKAKLISKLTGENIKDCYTKLL